MAETRVGAYQRGGCNGYYVGLRSQLSIQVWIFEPGQGARPAYLKPLGALGAVTKPIRACWGH